MNTNQFQSQYQRSPCPPGRQIYMGPRGGFFTLSANNRRNYCDPEQTINQQNILRRTSTVEQSTEYPGCSVICREGPAPYARRQGGIPTRPPSPYVRPGPRENCSTFCPPGVGFAPPLSPRLANITPRCGSQRQQTPQQPQQQALQQQQVFQRPQITMRLSPRPVRPLSPPRGLPPIPLSLRPLSPSALPRNISRSPIQPRGQVPYLGERTPFNLY